MRAGDAATAKVVDLARFGDLLLEAGMAAEAGDMFDRALEVQGESPDMLRRLALARFRAGDREGGIAASRRVVRLDPSCVASMHNLALAALEDGRYRIASGWIKQGIAIDRHDDGLRRLRMRLGLKSFAHGFGRMG